MIQKSPTQARMNEIHAQSLNTSLINFSLQKAIKFHHLYWDTTNSSQIVALFALIEACLSHWKLLQEEGQTLLGWKGKEVDSR
jgi:hypothetical protein